MSGLTESNVSAENIPVGSFVQAILNYFAEFSEKPVIYTSEPSPGIPRTRGNPRLERLLFERIPAITIEGCPAIIGHC
jgi:hypothetical protein